MPRAFSLSAMANSRAFASAPAAFYVTYDVPAKGHPPFLAEPPLPGLPLSSTLHVMWHAPFANGEPIEKFFLEVDGVEV